MSALPVRRLATTALCASLLIGAAAPAFAADTAVAPARSALVTADLAAAADPAPPSGILAGILAPVTGLLGGLLGTNPQPAPEAEKPAPEAAPAAPAPLAADPAEENAELTPLDAQKQATAIEKALPKDATKSQTEAMASLHEAIDAYVRAAAAGDTDDAATDLRSAVSDLVDSLTSQWLGGAAKY
ncbi:hypothetical protein [Streptomyces sp. NPDC046939]|uniref:hypothetical protein n=1 Tax=Streptomyces sp. NPDC046939 TaxID=3155376 RepID=UPI0033D74EA8